jgi:surface antigen
MPPASNLAATTIEALNTGKIQVQGTAGLESPHLSKIDKADALIASIAATDILLNVLGLEEAPYGSPVPWQRSHAASQACPW